MVMSIMEELCWKHGHIWNKACAEFWVCIRCPKMKYVAKPKRRK